MAPRRGESIEHTTEHEAFIAKLVEFHKQRGTNFDPQPKVGVRHVDLYKLYDRVVEEGGYDMVCDTKARPLMWRKLAEEFVGKNVYTAAQAFQMKLCYYRNLVAYEIRHHWDKEPPPKEILEEVSAKGGNVMGRTLENFEKPASKEEVKQTDAAEDDSELRTPKEERIDTTEDSGSGLRSVRALRQQPPQRVIFHPDHSAGRQTRGLSATNYTSNTSIFANGFPNAPLINGASASLASYEPPQSYPLSLKPVTTPANNPEFYRNERKRKLEALAGPLAKKYRNIMLPGTGFIGPNIYVRAQLALQSGVLDEERYALHHLVKISHERGDKYRFDQFPGLAETLARKVISASSLFWNVDWDVNYEDDETYITNDETLCGLRGTANILAKLRSRPVSFDNDEVLDASFLDQLSRITEASLVIRNMCTMDDNARYAASLPITRDLFAISASLPDHWTVTEMRNYMLETAELVLRYCDVDTREDLYKSLLVLLRSRDRGTIILTLRVLGRIAMLLKAPKRLDHVETADLQTIQDWLLIEDEELRSACLDFLMQYTTFADNVENLLQAVDGEALARQLGQLLLHGAKDDRQPRQSNKANTSHNDHLIPPVPRLSTSIIKQLLKLEEPERSSEWLRMCFSPDPKSEMTQISLWQAYQGTFGAYGATHGNLVAGEFIKNVSTVFTGATAQVAGQNKYVIRGIRSRKVPVETGIVSGGRPSDKGKELLKCCWRVTHQVNGVPDPVTGVTPLPTIRQAECAEWFRSSTDMLQHINTTHLDIPVQTIQKPQPESHEMDVDGEAMTNGTSDVTSDLTEEVLDYTAASKQVQQCKWADCRRTSAEYETKPNIPRIALLSRHVATHLPNLSSRYLEHNIKPGEETSLVETSPLQVSIFTDEKHDAAGIPLNAALTLSHIARFMPGNTSSAKDRVRAAMGAEQDESHDREDDDEKLVEKIFGPVVKERMFFALAHCPPARIYVGNILRNMRRSAG